MYIILFDFCAVIILLLLIASATYRKQYAGRTNRILYCILFVTLLASVGDMLNGMIANYWEPSDFARGLMYAVNFVYFTAHNFVIFLFVHYVYACTDVWHIYRQSKVLNKVWFGLLAIDLLTLLTNGWLIDTFSVSESLEYKRGPFLGIYYAVATIVALWVVLALIKYRKLINADKMVVFILMFPVIIIGMIVQLFFPQVLIEMFTVAMIELMFIIMVRREENQVDPITGAIKYNEGIERVLRSIELKKPINIIFVKIANYNNLRLYLGQDSYSSFLKICTTKFKEIAKNTSNPTEIYYMGNGLFAYVIAESTIERVLDAADKTNEFFFKNIEVNDFEILVDARICEVNCPDDISDFQTLYTLANTFHHTMPDDKRVHVYATYKYDLSFKIRNEIKDILKRGLEENNFHMYYQPIYSIVEQRFVSAEALLRLEDNKYGKIPPSVFIPMAEMEGSIHGIGDFVLENVIKFVADNDIEKLGLKYIEMNLSASQCIEVDLVDKIKGLLEKYKVEPDKISLELTETAADINPQIVDQNIEALHNHGIRIALDDYGTGYSNIKRVTALPIDQVKLDKSFVDMIDDKQMWIVIQDTVNMLKEMGKEILVEGVEKEDVAKRFTALDTDLFLGCELVQGFYFCKPLPEQEFIEFIKSHVTS